MDVNFMGRLKMRLFLIVSSILLLLFNLSIAEEAQTIFNLKELLGKRKTI